MTTHYGFSPKTCCQRFKGTKCQKMQIKIACVVKILLTGQVPIFH